jgi:hypothetical protein
MPRLREVPAKRIAFAVEGDRPGREAARALAFRNLTPESQEIEAAIEMSGTGAVAFAPAQSPPPERAAQLAPLCAEAARSGRPVVMLAAFSPAAGRAAVERACALAYLRAHGAILCPDPDVWLETLVLLSIFGVPAGPRAAIVAPPGSWLAASATALAAEAATRGARFSPVAPEAARIGPADAVLVDPSELSQAHAERTKSVLVVPVVPRPELAGERAALVGLRAALAAVAAAGRFAERMAAGLGPDELLSAPAVDQERLRRQIDKLDRRAGDHETKVLLSACGVEVTRQVVAMTPSAAAAKAKRVGFPVEIKPWSPEAPTEFDGCPVEKDVQTAASVRRAYAAIGAALGEVEAPVIVREPPPSGRELRARISPQGPLGLCVVVEVLGLPSPLAAPAPLRLIDAAELARAVATTRAGEPEPDRRALAELLRAASFVIPQAPRIESLDLIRVVAAPRGERALVVDARAVLLTR